jgi:hypothetical protein
MDDPAYIHGVRSESITAMFQSIVDVSKGKSPHILVPVPIGMIAPATHIHFRGRSENHLEPLRFRSRNSQSRRSYSRSLSNGVDGDLPTEEIVFESFNQNDIHDEIMSTIDDFDTLSVVSDVIVEAEILQAPSPVHEDTSENANVELNTEPPRRRRRVIS